MNEEKGLLHPALRGVIDKHVVPTHRCRMLRYTLSRVCRALWKRLRCERFLQFAAVVSGHMSLHQCALYEDLTFREECVRFIWPSMPAVLDYQAFWGDCLAASDEIPYMLLGVRKHFRISLPLPDIMKISEMGSKNDTFPCACWNYGRICPGADLLTQRQWGLSWNPIKKRVVLTLDFAIKG